MKKTAAKGRPRKSAITRFKVMAWFNAVAQASGKTAAELEREFSDRGQVRKVNGREVRPKLWEKYRRGEVEPRNIPSKGKAISLVQEVEKKYPNTAQWLTLHIMEIGRFQPAHDDG